MNTLSKTNHQPKANPGQHMGMGGFKKLINEMKAKQFDSIRFAAYRTACKLRYIQQRTRLILLDVRGVVESFRQSGLYLMEPSCSLDRNQIESMVSQLYSQLASRLPAGDQLHPNIVPESIEMLLGWLLYSYDTSGAGRLTVMALKVALSTLASGKPADKFKYHFTLLTDPSGALIPTRFEQYLHDLLVLAVGVFEGPNFAYNSQASKFILGGRSKAIVIEEFLDKMLADPGPQCLLWLNIFHRLSNIENVRHNVRCEGCHREVIIGFRYKCQKCHNYNLCQDCFWTGVITGNHNNSHDVKEYTSSSKSHSRQFGHAIRKSWDRQNNAISLGACAGGGAKNNVPHHMGGPMQHNPSQHMAAMNYNHHKYQGQAGKLASAISAGGQASPCMPYRNNTVSRMQDPANQFHRASPSQAGLHSNNITTSAGVMPISMDQVVSIPMSMSSAGVIGGPNHHWSDSTGRITSTPMLQHPYNPHQQQQHHLQNQHTNKDWRQFYHDDEHRLIARYASTLASSGGGRSSHFEGATSAGVSVSMTNNTTNTNTMATSTVVTSQDSTDAPKIEVHLRSELFNQSIPTSAKSQKELITKLEAKNREILREIQRLRLEQQQNASAVTAAANKGGLAGFDVSGGSGAPGGAMGQSGGVPGGITNPNLLAELRSLRHRKDELESRMNSLQDSRLELMQQLESLMRVLNTSSSMGNNPPVNTGPLSSQASLQRGPPHPTASPMTAHRSFSYSVSGGAHPSGNSLMMGGGSGPDGTLAQYSTGGRLGYLTGPPKFNTLTRHSRTFSADEGLGGFGIGPQHGPPNQPGHTGSLSLATSRRYGGLGGPGGLSGGMGPSRTLDSLGLVDSATDSYHLKSLTDRSRGHLKDHNPQLDLRRDLLAAADNVTNAMSGLVRELQPSSSSANASSGMPGGLVSNNNTTPRLGPTPSANKQAEYEADLAANLEEMNARRSGINMMTSTSGMNQNINPNSSNIFSNSRISSRVLSDQRFLNELRARRQHHSVTNSSGGGPPPSGDNLLGESPPPNNSLSKGGINPPPLPPHRSRVASTNIPPPPTLHSASEYQTGGSLRGTAGAGGSNGPMLHPPSQQYHHTMSAESDSEAYLYSDPECSLMRNSGSNNNNSNNSMNLGQHNSLGRGPVSSNSRIQSVPNDSDRLADIQNINQKLNSLKNGDIMNDNNIHPPRPPPHKDNHHNSQQHHHHNMNNNTNNNSNNNNSKDFSNNKNPNQNWEDSINRWINE